MNEEIEERGNPQGEIMNNGDYVPLDQGVIDQEVEELEKKRTEAKAESRDALKDAGGNRDIIVFHDKRVIKALNALGIFWCEVDGEIYANRHELNWLIAG